MASLNKNVQSINNVFSNVKSAIEDRGVTVLDDTPVTSYPELISKISTGLHPRLADIYNHGSVVGLNPMYSNYKKFESNSLCQIYVDEAAIYWTNYMNNTAQQSNITFTTPIEKGGYTKLYFDCEVPYGYYINSAQVSFGIRYCSEGLPTDYTMQPTVSVDLVSGSTQTNYDNTEVWCALSRQIVELDLTQVKDEPFYLMLYGCADTVNVYSIWLGTDDDPKMLCNTPSTLRTGDVIHGVTITQQSSQYQYCYYCIINNTIYQLNTSNVVIDNNILTFDSVYTLSTYSTFLQEGRFDCGLSYIIDGLKKIDVGDDYIIHGANLDIYDGDGNIIFTPNATRRSIQTSPNIKTNADRIAQVCQNMKVAIEDRGINVAKGLPITTYPNLIMNIVTQDGINSTCYEVNGATSLTGAIYAQAGDIVLATITARSAMTLPDTLTLLNTSDPIVGSDGATQTMTFAYQKITATGVQNYTINQASAGRLYLNLIVLRGIKDIKYTGKYCTLVSGTGTVIAPPKTEDELLIWGCSSVFWNTNTQGMGDWVSTFSDILISLDGNTTQPRQANFFDFNNEGVRRFIAALNDASGTAIVVDAVELIVSEDFYLNSEDTMSAFKLGDKIEGVEITNITTASLYCPYFYYYFVFDNYIYLVNDKPILDLSDNKLKFYGVWYRSYYSTFLSNGSLQAGGGADIDSGYNLADIAVTNVSQIKASNFDIYDTSGNLVFASTAQ